MKYSSAEEEVHKAFMKSILLEISKKDLPLFLKGGTALLLCHNLDRFSEDIDLNANIKLNLESIIRNAAKSIGIESLDIKLAKDTDTTRRYKVFYQIDKSLKIEISMRDRINSDEIDIFNGIKAYKIEPLIGMKLNAIDGRMVARDFHDIVFLANNYPLLFSQQQKESFVCFAKDIEKIFLYESAYFEDPLLVGRYEEDLKSFEECAIVFSNQEVSLSPDVAAMSDDEREAAMDEIEGKDVDRSLDLK